MRLSCAWSKEKTGKVLGRVNYTALGHNLSFYLIDGEVDSIAESLWSPHQPKSSICARAKSIQIPVWRMTKDIILVSLKLDGTPRAKLFFSQKAKVPAMGLQISFT